MPRITYGGLGGKAWFHVTRRSDARGNLFWISVDRRRGIRALWVGSRTGLFVAAPRNSAHVVGVDDAREMTEKLRQMTTVALEALSNLPELRMDEAAVAPLTLNRSPSELR